MVDNLLLKKADYFNRLYIVNLIVDQINLESKDETHCRAHLFGSSVNNIGFNDADVDVYVECNKASGTEEQVLKKIRKILQKSKLRQFYFSKFINSKRCPILKIIPLDNERLRKFTIDLNVSHPVAVFNSQFLRHLFARHPLIQQLLVVLKYFGKHSEIISSSGFTSFAFTILVLFFLQHHPSETGPVLSPNFGDVLCRARQFEKSIGDKHVALEADDCVSNVVNVEALNSCSLFQLVVAFFG